MFCGKRFELPTGLHASGRKVGAQLGSGGLMNLQPAALPTEVGRRVLAELARSELVVGYVRDFRELVAATIELCAADSWPACKTTGECSNPFCGSMPKFAGECAACLDAERAMIVGGASPPITVACSPGLPETGVPVRLDESVIGFLVIRSVVRDTPINSRRRAAGVRLLIVFAQHLSLLAAGLILRAAQGEPSAITRARVFIDKNYAESLSLASAAKAAHVSAVYFCRIFKKATGLGFSDYLARLRIDRAKGLLRDSGLRVNEIALAVGFGSIPHFNRVFKRLVGKSPSEFREG